MCLRALQLMGSGLIAILRPVPRQDAVVLTAVKEWPGSGGASGEVGVSAILVGRCARRLLDQATAAAR